MLLDVTDRMIVIIGGGAVAARKAAGLVAAGARRIRCVAPKLGPDLPATIEQVAEAYCERHLEGAALVFAVTDQHEVNDAVVRDARRRGILVNRADTDEAEPGDFSTPAKWQAGALIVTVSASSAALSAAIRDEIALNLDRRYVKMADAMQLLRPQIRASSLDATGRSQLLREMAGDEALEVLERGGLEALRQWMGQRLADLRHG